jgi:hypothetical protein
MLSVFQKKPQILAEAQKARFRPVFILQILIFVGLYLVTSIAESIPIIIYVLFKSVTAAMNQEISLNDPSGMMDYSVNLQNNMVLPSLLVTGIVTILIIIYCRFIEKRSLYSMGFNRKNAVGQYFSGLAVGFVMFGTCVGISWATGSLQFNGFTLGSGFGLLMFFLVGFIIQGMSEEVFLRGYFMMSVAGKNSILLAVISNSVIFAVMHLGNPGVTFLAIVNLILFGLFASVYTLKMNSIWGICAIHTIWNFAQGNLFGIKVSGLDTQVSVLSFLPAGTGELFNGGAFGLEGGLAVTIVLVLSTLVVLKLPGREIVKPEETLEEHPSTPLSSAM